MQEGHIIIVSCILVYIVAFFFYKKEKFGLGIIFLIISAAIIRIYMGSHQFLMPWDERFHALVAKNMMDNPFKPMLFKETLLPYDYTDWSRNHIWLHKPPMGLWLITLSYYIFGVNEWALRFPSLIMSLMTIFLIYKMGHKLFTKKVGWLAAFCFSLVASPITVSTGITCCDHVDTPFMGFIILGIYWGVTGVQKNKMGYFVLTGIVVGFAILTKWLTGLIVIGVVGVYLMQQKDIRLFKKLGLVALMLVISIIVFMPWQVHIFNAFPKEAAFEYAYNSKHIFDSVEGHEGSPWFHIDELNFQFSPFFYVMFPLGFILLIKNKQGAKITALFFWVFIPLIFFSLVKTKMVAFCLFIYPAVAIVIGYGMHELIVIKSKLKFVTLIPVLGLIGWVGFNTVDFLKLNGDYVKDNYFNTVIFKRKEQIITESKKIENKQFVVFNSVSYIEWMYYTDNCTAAYDKLPDSLTLVGFKNQGYEVLVYNIERDEYILE